MTDKEKQKPQETEQQKRMDEVLKRMLNTPPEPRGKQKDQKK